MHSAVQSGTELWTFWQRITGLDHIRYALPLLLVCGVVLLWVAWRYRGETQGVAAAVIIIWSAAYFAGFGAYSKGIYEQYFVALFPLPFLMMGLAADRIWWSVWGPLGRIAVLATVFALVGSNLTGLWHTDFQLRPYQIDQGQFGGVQATGMTIEDVQQVVDYIASVADHHSFKLVLAASDDHDMGYRYLLHLKGLVPSREQPPTPSQRQSRDPAIAYPGIPRRFFLIVQPRWWPQAQWPQWIRAIHTTSGQFGDTVHPDVAFRYALVRYIEQRWVPLDVSRRYDELPCDEGQDLVPPTSCSAIQPPVTGHVSS